MSSGGLPIGVGKTALGAAMVRAHESRRADRLFNDPHAEAFLIAGPGVFVMEQRAAKAGAGDMASWGGATLWSHAVISTRFFDDYLFEVGPEYARNWPRDRRGGAVSVRELCLSVRRGLRCLRPRCWPFAVARRCRRRIHLHIAPTAEK